MKLIPALVALAQPAPAEPVRARRSARAILIDGAGRVLLIRFVVPRDGTEFTFWATPGGGVEDGESDLAAAEREIGEELDLSVTLTGPVHRAVARFEHDGTIMESTDVFFAGRYDGDAPRFNRLTDAERGILRETKWWSASEIAQSVEAIFPPDLGSVVSRLVQSAGTAVEAASLGNI